ncbi:MAG: EamA family transporter RarD [Desulfarculaceae bacterium]|nr:EamA family transporter RarD [Desulfarculaceae bacterium]MCF8074361.1 EamA family transporter RarD [Desulfarculaceae bacterium]MCF8103539.1 EamA family transporter RarD [Desulfarculaceae bacterium]MCF8117306.1 EamA family transporter RarD [Desulfarculaceae bacterium]
MQDPQAAKGYAYSMAAFVWWGLFPLYVRALGDTPPLEVVAQRIVWSLPVCALLISLARQWGELRRALARPRVLVTLLCTASIIAGNWLVFIYAVWSNQLLSASLGYFISPLVSMAMGMVFLGERPGRLRLAALILAGLGTLNLVLHHGELPWIALALAASFSTYGLLRKQVRVEAVGGLLVETALLTPLALGWLFWSGWHGELVFGQDWTISLLLAGAGLATTLPLIWFTAGARLIPLHTLGILQYSGPSIQFLIALFLFDEVVSPTRWLTFFMVWAAVALYLAASFKSKRA